MKNLFAVVTLFVAVSLVSFSAVAEIDGVSFSGSDVTGYKEPIPQPSQATF